MGDIAANQILTIGWPGLIALTVYALVRCSFLSYRVQWRFLGAIAFGVSASWLVTMYSLAFIATAYLLRDPAAAVPLVRPIFYVWILTSLALIGLLETWARVAIHIDHLRERMTEEVAEKTSELASVLRLAPVGIMTVDPDGVITAANPFMLTMVGATETKELVGKMIEKFPSLIETGLDERIRAAIGGKPFDIELEMNNLVAHEPCWRHYRATPLVDAGGRHRGAIVLVSDITERKLLEVKVGEYARDLERRVASRTREIQAALEGITTKNRDLTDARSAMLNLLEDAQAHADELQESEKRFRALVENSSDAIMIIDRDGKIVYVSPADEKISGIPATERIGSDPLGQVHPDDVAHAKEVFARSLTVPGTAMRDGSRIIRQDGSVRSVSAIMQNLLEDPVVRGIVVNYRDVTEERAAAGRVQELAQMVESSFEGVLVADGTKEHLIQYVNAAWERMTGWTREEVVGKKNPRILKSGLMDAPFYESLWKTILSGETFRGEIVNKRKDGALYTSAIAIFPVQTPDGGTVYAEVSQDISEKRRSEARIRELDELRRKFIQIISHQLRTPLNSIRWNLEALMTGDLGKLKPEQQKFVHVTHDADVEVIRRIHDLLTAMDIEEGRVAIMRELASLESLWGSVLAEWKKRCVIKDLACTYVPPAKPLPDVEVDAEKMREVFWKLMENAVIYTPERGKVEATLETADGNIRFSVTDTGVGIPKGEQPRIFTRFYRATNAASMKPDASGLGLSIAKFFVEQHGGKIGFTSREGKGSTFWFDIPVKHRNTSVKKR